MATIGGYLLSSLFGVFPIGVAIGLGGGIRSEVLIGRRAESQRRQLGAVLCEQTPEIFARCADGVKENLRTLYLDTIHATQRACNAWAQGQIAAIDAAQVRAIDPEGEQKLRQTQKVLAQILSLIHISMLQEGSAGSEIIPESMELVDQNGDGIADGVMFQEDTNGDGVADTVTMLSDSNGD